MKPIITIYFFGATTLVQRDIKKIAFKYRKNFDFEYDEMNHHIKDRIGIWCNYNTGVGSFKLALEKIEEIFDDLAAATAIHGLCLEPNFEN